MASLTGRFPESTLDTVVGDTRARSATSRTPIWDGLDDLTEPSFHIPDTVMRNVTEAMLQFCCISAL